MRLSLRHRTAPAGPGINGTARVDTRTKSLTKRLRPGDIAVIDHLDVDRVSAEALVACRPAAVLNAARSTSGRYPNLGPDILVEERDALGEDRKSTRLNSSHVKISYAVFCLKKKKFAHARKCYAA